MVIDGNYLTFCWAMSELRLEHNESTSAIILSTILLEVARLEETKPTAFLHMEHEELREILIKKLADLLQRKVLQISGFKCLLTSVVILFIRDVTDEH